MSRSYSPAVPVRYPIRSRTFCGSFTISNSSMVAVPLVGARMVASMRSVVVFPAPFAPRSPNISPGRALNENIDDGFFGAALPIFKRLTESANFDHQA